MHQRLDLLKIGLISICVVIMTLNKALTQEYATYESGKTNFDIGFTVGTTFFYSNIEVTALVSRRVSHYTILEAKPLAGLISQLLLFEGNNDRYRIPYLGGTLGLSLGKKSKFFEVALGSAYFINPQSGWGDSAQNILPITTIGYKKKFRNGTFRIGVGFPNGLYLSLLF